MSTRVVVVGPPNSGKSVFVARLKRAFQNQGLRAEKFDLDPWSATQKLIDGAMSKDERKTSKKKIVEDDEITRLIDHVGESENSLQVSVIDTAGQFTDQTKRICQIAKYGIIVCSEDCKKQVDEWISNLNESGVQLIAVVTTKPSGIESVSNSNIITATITNLHRSSSEPSEHIMEFSVLLSSKLDL